MLMEGINKNYLKPSFLKYVFCYYQFYTQMNKLICLICKLKLQFPKMCPHCSQVFCQMCIRNYLAEKHFCPSCDNYIIDLVDCGRLVDELQQVVHARTNSTHAPRLCRLHQLQLTYYCKDCSSWICSDCGVIQAVHRGHTILNKNQAFFSSKENLNQQLNKVTQKIKKIITRKQKCHLDLQVYKTELKWSKSKIQKYYQELIAKLDNQGSKQITEMTQRIKEYEKNLQIMKKKQQEIQKIIQSGNIVYSRIGSSSQLNKSPLTASISQFINISDINEQQDQENVFFNKAKKIQVIDEIFPNFAYYTYQFDYQNLKQDNFHYSDYFQLWGQDWRLKIYPNGNSGVTGKFLSVFLELASGHHLQKPKRYVYKIQLLSLNRAGSTIVKQYCSVFDSGQSWGYSDFLNLHNLHQYVHEGKLLFSIGIRNQSYEGLCCDLKKYIIKIENQNKILEKLLCEGVVQQSINHSKMKQYQISDFQSSIRMEQLSDIQISLAST